MMMGVLKYNTNSRAPSPSGPESFTLPVSRGVMSHIRVALNDWQDYRAQADYKVCGVISSRGHACPVRRNFAVQDRRVWDRPVWGSAAPDGVSQTGVPRAGCP